MELLAGFVNCGFVFWESFGNGFRLLYGPEEPGDEKIRVNMQLFQFVSSFFMKFIEVFRENQEENCCFSTCSEYALSRFHWSASLLVFASVP